MDSSSLDFFKDLLNAPGPSGFERPVQEVVRKYMASFADEITTDRHGNVYCVKNREAPLRLMFAGHCDQIGMLVNYIDGDGFIYAATIGGWDPQVLIGQKLIVWTSTGPLNGVTARKPIHLLTDEERRVAVKVKDLWIDIGAKTKEEAAQRVKIGDPITMELGFRPMLNNLASSTAMDNRTGLWVVMEALRRASQKTLNCALYAVSTVAEEIGLRGAQTSTYTVDPHVGIAVDVTHATDCPTMDKKQDGEIKVGSGPVVFRGPNMSPPVVDRLFKLAETNNIAFQPAASGRATGTDANVMQTSRGGVATGLVSIPNRYMHSPVEVISLDDIDRAADLLAAFACDLAGDEDFIP
jgi:putative aminopeptidase FrvX